MTRRRWARPGRWARLRSGLRAGSRTRRGAGLQTGLVAGLLAGALLLPGTATTGRAAVRAAGSPDALARPATPASHDLHIAYADLAVEGAIVAGRIRIFKDDLERALGRRIGADAVTLRPGREADALVMTYLREHLRIEADSAPLRPTLLRSGEDYLDREPVWWVVVQYEAGAPIDALRVRNTILFEVFDDQRNIMKFVRFPDRTQRTYYFAADEDEHTVRF